MPRDTLPRDITNARILTYGYNANIVGGLEGLGKNNISQHGNDLIMELASKLQNQVRMLYQKPIIFVVYSLGWIIIKDA